MGAPIHDRYFAYIGCLNRRDLPDPDKWVLTSLLLPSRTTPALP